MQGTIELSIALTTTGNAFVAGMDIGRFWPAGDVFAFCRSVRFLAQPDEAPIVVAEDPDSWFETLKREERRLRLRTLPSENGFADRKVGMIGDGPRWIIEGLDASGAGVGWEDVWRHSGDLEGDPLPWTVEYWRCSEPLPAAAVDRPPGDIAADLGRALDDIAGYAVRSAPEWAGHFRGALDVLEGRSAHPFPERLAPRGALPASAERMLAVCDVAWAFGGMGAWDDRVSGSAEEERLTARLFSLLVEGIVAAANASSRGLGG
jgi:hypothetical protein